MRFTIGAILAFALACAAPAMAAPTPSIFELARDGEIAQLRNLLDRGAQLDQRDEHGFTPLMFAAGGGDGPAARLLLERGADPMALNKQGATALHQAAHSGSEEVVWLLLQRGVPVDPVTTTGHTPLHFAIRAQQWSVVRTLLAAGADLLATPRGRAALTYALSFGDELNYERTEPLPVDLAQTLAANGASLDATDETTGGSLIHLAAAWRNAPMVEYLLAQGQSARAVDKTGVTPLQRAVATSSLEKLCKAVDLLVTIADASAQRGLDGRQIERAFCNAPNPLTGFDIGAQRRVISARRVATINALLAAGADPNQLIEGKSDLVGEVASSGDGAAMAALLEGGANPNRVHPERTTALERAARSGYREVVYALLAGGADPNLANAAGRTPLMAASVGGGDGPIVEALIRAGARVDTRDAQGRTALHYVVGVVPDYTADKYTQNSEQVAVVRSLLAAGADPNAEDNSGVSPIEAARKSAKYRPAANVMRRGG